VIVVDTNLVLYVLIPGEFTDAARIAYQSDPEWVAPASWKPELLNVVSTYCRKKLLSIDEGVEIYRRGRSLVRDLPVEPEPAHVLNLSVASGISGYDSIFAAAARMNSLPLVTFDQQLLKALPDTAIKPDQIAAWFDQRPHA
jgi:predicted nucleic acid-binding protein